MGTPVPDLSGCVHWWSPLIVASFPGHVGGEKWPGNKANTLITVLSLDIPIKAFAVAYSVRPSHLRTTDCVVVSETRGHHSVLARPLPKGTVPFGLLMCPSWFGLKTQCALCQPLQLITL